MTVRLAFMTSILHDQGNDTRRCSPHRKYATRAHASWLSHRGAFLSQGYRCDQKVTTLLKGSLASVRDSGRVTVDQRAQP
jgi:hypothetical protein